MGAQAPPAWQASIGAARAVFKQPRAWQEASSPGTHQLASSLHGLQLVYGELRDIIFEQLYRFHVQVARLEVVLQVGVVAALGQALAAIHAHRGTEVPWDVHSKAPALPGPVVSWEARLPAALGPAGLCSPAPWELPAMRLPGSGPTPGRHLRVRARRAAAAAGARRVCRAGGRGAERAAGRRALQVGSLRAPPPTPTPTPTPPYPPSRGFPRMPGQSAAVQSCP